MVLTTPCGLTVPSATSLCSGRSTAAAARPWSAGGFGSALEAGHSPKVCRGDANKQPRLKAAHPTSTNKDVPLSGYGHGTGMRVGAKAGQTSTSGESASGPTSEHRCAQSASTCGERQAGETPSVTDHLRGCYGAGSAARSSAAGTGAAVTTTRRRASSADDSFMQSRTQGTAFGWACS